MSQQDSMVSPEGQGLFVKVDSTWPPASHATPQQAAAHQAPAEFDELEPERWDGMS
ncbi:MAG TPA: hypothetical protein VIL86_10725 [Tepidisphaeraceae bacterium]|jgi:hypothetical protein